MKEIGRYDPDLEMFVQAPKPVNGKRLLFERWLCQSGRGEHLPFSRPVGELALTMVVKQNLGIEEILAQAYKKPEVKRRTIVQGD